MLREYFHPDEVYFKSLNYDSTESRRTGHYSQGFYIDKLKGNTICKNIMICARRKDLEIGKPKKEADCNLANV